MKKIIIAAMLVFSISSCAQQQNSKDKKSNKRKTEQLTPEQRYQVSLDKMTKELELSASQQEQVKPIIVDQIAKKEAMRAERMVNDSKKMSKEERNEWQAKRIEDQRALDAKYQAILTPEQFKKMKSNEEANKERMRAAKKNWDEKNDINDQGTKVIREQE